MSKGEFTFVALGGIGEIGMNAYIYGQGQELLLVDLGITFADDRFPGAEIILPDISYLREQKDRLAGLVLTHAHEDHLGAVPHLWPALECPIWCSPFTAAVLRRKLADTGLSSKIKIHEVAPGQPFAVGGFECRFIHVTHSIPEAAALVIDTAHGPVLHTGDWKLDPAPMLGDPTDGDALETLGQGKVLAMICDSTNVLSAGTAGSEAEVRDSLVELVANQPNRVAMTGFASNLVRIETGIVAAKAAGREVFVIGRSMRRMLDAAREVGYLTHLPALGDERDVHSMPRHRSFFLCTGSQGEPRSAMARIAAMSHPRVRMEAGDTAIFSSKIIPGNERTLFNMHNLLVSQGVEVITEEDHFVHVSGHPCRDDLEQMYRWVRPRIAVPMHGEARHLSAHVRLAKRMGVEQAMLLANGDVLRLAPGPATIVGKVPVGRIVVDSEDHVDSGDELFRARRRLAGNGTVVVGLVLDDAGTVLAPPGLTVIGVIDPARVEKLRASMLIEITDAVEALDDETVLVDGRVEEVVRATVRQVLNLNRQRRPLVEVQISRLGSEVLAALEDDEAGVTTR